MKPTVAVLLGDAGGVGPEMALKLLARDANRQAAQVLLIGSADLLADAERVDTKKYPKYAAGQTCANCALYQGKAADKAGGCPLFAGKQVAGAGWCSAWAKKA